MQKVGRLQRGESVLQWVMRDVGQRRQKAKVQCNKRALARPLHPTPDLSSACALALRQSLVGIGDHGELYNLAVFP